MKLDICKHVTIIVTGRNFNHLKSHIFQISLIKRLTNIISVLLKQKFLTRTSRNRGLTRVSACLALLGQHLIRSSLHRLFKSIKTGCAHGSKYFKNIEDLLLLSINFKKHNNNIFYSLNKRYYYRVAYLASHTPKKFVKYSVRLRNASDLWRTALS